MKSSEFVDITNYFLTALLVGSSYSSFLLKISSCLVTQDSRKCPIFLVLDFLNDHNLFGYVQNDNRYWKARQHCCLPLPWVTIKLFSYLRYCYTPVIIISHGVLKNLELYIQLACFIGTHSNAALYAFDSSTIPL
jgi:hypothetical protein